MLILRIRQAETALADGRLDEAYELARAEDLRAHRRGQELIGELARHFLERGRKHLSAGQLHEALSDCEKAGKLGGHLVEAAQLRAEIDEKLASRQRQSRQARATLDAARQCMEAGRLSAAEAMLADLPAEVDQAVPLRRQAEHIRTAAETALQRAREALAASDFEAAAAALDTVRRYHPHHRELPEVVRHVVTGLVRMVHQCLRDGRMQRADLLTRMLSAIAGENSEVSELTMTVGHCRQAMQCLDRGRLREAGEILCRLRAGLPEAGWLTEACEAVGTAARKVEEVRSGPLGWFTEIPDAETAAAAEGPNRGLARATSDRPGTGLRADREPNAQGDSPLPDRFLLRVDGVGGFLVIWRDTVTIGPISGSRPPDVGLLAEPGTPTATIERDEEDYFLTMAGGAPGRRGQPPSGERRLLREGDRIMLSPRCLLRFSRPNAASGSAVLKLTGGRLPYGDTREVILMDRTIIIGPGPTCHVRAEELPRPVVLHLRHGRMYCQTGEDWTIDGRPADASQCIEPGRNVRVGGLSFHLAVG